MKHEWRKNEQEIYLPKKQPMEIKLPPMKYLTLQGTGNPNSDDFGIAVSALYAMSYGIKMALKKGIKQEGYFDYTVYPLEGFWSLNKNGVDEHKENGTFRKSDLVFKIMIRQPDFVTKDFALKIIEDVSKRKPNIYNSKISFEEIEEGICVQALHTGTYDTENTTFSSMESFCQEHNLQRLSPWHKEIYLSDPRKVSPEHNKTALRFSVKKI